MKLLQDASMTSTILTSIEDAQRFHLDDNQIKE